MPWTTMTIYARAREVYASEPCARTFDEDLDLHLQYGSVYCTQSTMLWWRPVLRSWSYRDLTDPSVVAQEPDCWWIHLAVGDLCETTKLFSAVLPWIGYERTNVPRFFSTSRYLRAAAAPLSLHLQFLPRRSTLPEKRPRVWSSAGSRVGMAPPS